MAYVLCTMWSLSIGIYPLVQSLKVGGGGELLFTNSSIKIEEVRVSCTDNPFPVIIDTLHQVSVHNIITILIV